MDTIKITAVRTVPLAVPVPGGLSREDAVSIGCLCVFVDTDQEITGESLLFSFDLKQLPVFATTLASVQDVVIGQDPRYVQRIFELLWPKAASPGRQGPGILAISAIDRACWDILGKAANQPLRMLLGARRDDVPAYASGLWLWRDLDALTREASSLVEQGFRAIKMRVGKPRIDDDVARVRAVRETVGPDVALMVDANKRLTVDHAIGLGRRLEAFDLAWFEEPVPADDLAGSAAIARALDVPVASGESEYTRYGFRTMIELGAADVLMPDLARVGGISELLRVAGIAAAYDLPVTPHSYPHESLQVLGAIPTGTYLECLPWFYPVYREQIEVREGRVRMFDAPGLGCSFDPDAIERFRLD